MEMRQAIEYFLMDREVRGCADTTVSYYRLALEKFVEQCDGDEIDLQQQVPVYIYALRQRDISDYTVHANFRAVRAFARFCEENGWSEGVRLPKVKTPDKEIVSMSVGQVRKLINHFDEGTFTGLRNKAMMVCFYDTGIRLGELVKLDLQDVDYGRGFLFVHGKGNKDRYVPFSRKCRNFLWTYQKASVDRRADDESAFWINRIGRRLKIDGVKQVFKNLSKQIDMPNIRISAHTLRHSFALSHLEQGGDLQSLQKIMGHTSPEITLRYGRMAKNHMKSQHERFSPGNRI